MIAESDLDTADMCRHHQEQSQETFDQCQHCDALAGPVRDLLRVEAVRPRTSSIGSHTSEGSGHSPLSTGSNYSAQSVDHERDAIVANNKFFFGSDLKFDDEKKTLANLIRTKEVLVGGADCKTKLLERLGGGSFGEVYLGELINGGQKVAVKLEPQNLVNKFLLHEGTVYRQLEGGPGIPEVFWFGLYGSDYCALVMEILGPTLEHHFQLRRHRLSLKTVLLLAEQMIDIIGHIHSKNIVHRDLSPNNYMMGVGENASKLYLIDYGHAKKVATSFQYIPGRMRNSKKRPMVGTPRFASIHTHMGQEESRRDDLESICYIWIYLLKGRLPWQGVRVATHEEKLKRILELKMNTPVSVLCENLPKEFATFMEYVRGLKLYDKPDYKQLKDFFHALYVREGFEDDGKYDWDVEVAPKAVAIPKIITTDCQPPKDDSPNIVSH